MDSSAILARFNRLMYDLENGASTRTCFAGWEVELLADFASCRPRVPNWSKTLRRYRRAAQRHIEKGAPRPLKLSEYLARRRPRRVPCAILEAQTGCTPAA